MKAARVILFLASLLLVGAAFGTEVNIDIGVTKFTAAPCGNWYQCTSATPYTLRLTSLSGSIGIYTDQFYGGWQIGAGVGNGGRFTSDAIVCDVDGPCPRWSLSHMQGQGSDPFAFIDIRYSFGQFTIGVQGYDSFMRYENTNFNWHNVYDQNFSPVVSHIEHDPKGKLGIGISAAYKLSRDFSIIAKLIPTAANNSQYDPVSGQMTWYRPVASSSIGYSPNISLEYKF